MTLYARIKSGTPRYWFTKDKLYPVLSAAKFRGHGRQFEVEADDKIKCTCLERKCPHLSGGDWELFEKPEAKEEPWFDVNTCTTHTRIPKPASRRHEIYCPWPAGECIC